MTPAKDMKEDQTDSGSSPRLPSTDTPTSAGPSAPSGANPGSAPPQPSAPGSQTCCESGRPVLTDPITGQSVCSCQYESTMLNYQRLAAGLGPLGLYAPGATSPAGYPSSGGPDQPPFLPLTQDQLQSFYPGSVPGNFDLKDLESWRLPYPPAAYYPYDGGLPGYPFPNGYVLSSSSPHLDTLYSVCLSSVFH